jgi:hypothetical protein
MQATGNLPSSVRHSGFVIHVILQTIHVKALLGTVNVMAHVQPKHAVPYVFSKKSCKEHMAFITKYFKGTETYIIESHDGTGRVMHASMTVHGGPIYLSDRIVKDGKGM